MAGVGSEGDRVAFAASEVIKNHASVTLFPDEQDEHDDTNVPVDDLQHE